MIDRRRREHGLVVTSRLGGELFEAEARHRHS